MKKTMILSSESDPDSSDEDSVTSSDKSNSLKSDDGSHSLGSDQYERSDDEIQTAIPIASNIADDMPQGTVLEQTLGAKKRTSTSSKTIGSTVQKHVSPGTKKRGNEQISKTQQKMQKRGKVANPSNT
jgi:hypothetical protein